MKRDELMKELEVFVQECFGEKCLCYEWGCPVCRAWECFEWLRDATEMVE